MLVLTRKIGEAIHIGSDVVVKVTAIDGGRVRIGVEAPQNIRVIREEIMQPGGRIVVPVMKMA